jgi:hypothetical protein
MLSGCMMLQTEAQKIIPHAWNAIYTFHGSFTLFSSALGNFRHLLQYISFHIHPALAWLLGVEGGHLFPCVEMKLEGNTLQY